MMNPSDHLYRMAALVSNVPACIALAVSVLVVPSAALGPVVASDRLSEIQATAARVNECFEVRLRSRAVNDIERTSPNGFRQAFLVERLLAETGEESTGSIESPDALCERLVVEYDHAVTEASAQAREEGLGSLAPLGMANVLISRSFLVRVNNAFLNHYAGHSELTKLALENEGFGDWAERLVIQGALAPDLYRWNAFRYHAHTDSLDGKDRQTTIEDSQRTFVTHIQSLLAKAVDLAAVGNDAESLLLLGSISHGVQDLAYHRGMTVRQHSGLAYAVDRNPDLPQGDLARLRGDEAVQNTKALLRLIRVTFGEVVWDRLRRWNPPPDFQFVAVARKLFPEGEDMTVRSLLEYWALSFDYRAGRRPKSELDPGENGLVIWNTAEIMGRIQQAVSLTAVHPSGTAATTIGRLGRDEPDLAASD